MRGTRLVSSITLGGSEVNQSKLGRQRNKHPPQFAQTSVLGPSRNRQRRQHQAGKPSHAFMLPPAARSNRKEAATPPAG